MDVDHVLSTVGETGCYQVLVYNLYCLLGVSTAFHHLTQVFTGGVSQYWCGNTTEYGSEDWQSSLPADDPNTFLDEHQCMQYSVYGNQSSGLVGCHQGYEFDHSRYTRTIQEDFKLVCNDKVKTSLAQSVYFAGVLVGSVIFGSLADRIGRKPTLIICVVMQCGFGTATAFVGSFEMYALLRFITATAAMGIFLVDFTIVSELAGVKWRTRIGTLLGTYWSFGLMILPATAYFIRDWRTLQIVLSVPIAFTLLYLPFLPESSRWLLSQGSVEQAEVTLRKLAGKKNTKLPKHTFLVSSEEKCDPQDKRKYTAIDLFRYPKLRMYTVNVMYNWFVVVMVYFAISINTSGLGIDPYLVFMINGFLEHPAHIVALIMIEKLGRRPSCCVLMLMSTVSCFVSGFIKPGVALVTVVMVGKFAVTAAFSVIYIHSGEIFPTPVRSAGMGVASMSGRFGSVFSPLVLLLSDWWHPLPVLFFSFVSFTSSIACLFLPETLGKKLPQKITVYSEPTDERGSNAETEKEAA